MVNLLKTNVSPNRNTLCNFALSLLQKIVLVYQISGTRLANFRNHNFPSQNWFFRKKTQRSRSFRMHFAFWLKQNRFFIENDLKVRKKKRHFEIIFSCAEKTFKLCGSFRKYFAFWLKHTSFVLVVLVVGQPSVCVCLLGEKLF